MAARTSRTQRLRVISRAEQAIRRYERDHALWHKHIHNTTLDPMQILKCVEMDEHVNTIDFSCRRTRKTSLKEIYCLKKLATSPMQDEGIVAPRLQQSQTNLRYHLEAIKRSPALTAYVDIERGRPQIGDTGYRFSNGSRATAYGIMSQIDGDSLTIASLEETDDMPYDRLVTRFLPMLGATGRMGVDPGAVEFRPSVRISGVFKGADVLQSLINSGNYHLLPSVDVNLGVEMGIVDAAWADQQRAQLSSAEWIRQFLCRNVAAQNHIWERYVRRALAVGLQAGIAAADPLPGARYRKRGLVAFGYDHLGHGEGVNPSRSALVVVERIGNFDVVVYCRSWAADTDDKVIENDLLALWEYFRPDYAIGDAYGVGMLTSLNDRLFARSLTEIDRRTIGDGRSVASTWAEWPFAPIRFEGMTKHSMAMSVRATFHNGRAAIAIFDEDDEACADWVSLSKQLPNMRAHPVKSGGYASYKMAEPKLGDDFFDATCAAIWAIETRGQADEPTVIATGTTTREQLLGAPVLPMLPRAA